MVAKNDAGVESGAGVLASGLSSADAFPGVLSVFLSVSALAPGGVPSGMLVGVLKGMFSQEPLYVIFVGTAIKHLVAFSEGTKGFTDETSPETSVRVTLPSWTESSRPCIVAGQSCCCSSRVMLQTVTSRVPLRPLKISVLLPSSLQFARVSKVRP